MTKFTKSQSESLQDNQRCILQEMVQYQCKIENNRVIDSKIIRCAGKPTIEVTPIYDKNGVAEAGSSSSRKFDDFYEGEVFKSFYELARIIR
ncbi:6789_t:CDS:2 [Ambispora leptoticha]|uniref:6789_t:CDS:1 n=1 Tax=Ambispora leptoticha TaxID=144679 RepID=A0A9N8WI28_9GLOM|nr:6789_t:CDS:2 [Ambispora leptoticha]